MFNIHVGGFVDMYGFMLLRLQREMSSSTLPMRENRKEKGLLERIAKHSKYLRSTF